MASSRRTPSLGLFEDSAVLHVGPWAVSGTRAMIGVAVDGALAAACHRDFLLAWLEWPWPGRVWPWPGRVCAYGSRTQLRESVLCLGFQIFPDLSCTFRLLVSLSARVSPSRLSLPSSLSCVLGLFVGRHLCFVLGNLVWGI